jgi:predicted phosphodiesterase
MNDDDDTIAVLADIHANHEALTAVFEDIEKRAGNCRIVCLGDIVGYGPDPGACLKLVRGKAWHIVAGNHDLAAITGESSTGMTREAEASARWTAAMIGTEEKTFLSGLPLEIKTGSFHFVHASPYQPSRFHYVLDAPAVKKAFLNSKGETLFTGHSHIPEVFVETEFRPMFAGCIHHVETLSGAAVKMIRRKRHLMNVGSVGQPRDGDPRAAYGIMKVEEHLFELIRVSYDVDTVLLKMKRHGLPVSLGERLKIGR